MASFKVTIEGDPTTNVFFVVNERELLIRDGKVELEVPEGEVQRLRYGFLGMPSMPYTVTVSAEEGTKVTTFDKDGKEVPVQPIKSKIPSNRITGVGLFRFIVRAGA